MLQRESTREQASLEKRYWLKISNVCNNHCIFCLDSDTRRKNNFEPVKNLTREIERAKSNGAKRLVVSGGEPTIHPQFIKIIETARAAGFKKIQVITNGRMFSYLSFTKAVTDAGLDEATFSIHGHTGELHDQLTGISGSFHQAKAGIKNLKSTGNCVVNIDIVVNKLNYKYVSDIIDYFITLGIFEYDLLYPIPFGLATANWHDLYFSYDEAIPYLKKAFAYSKNRKCYIWTNRFPSHYLEDVEELIQDPVKLYDEVLGRVDGFEEYRTRGHFYCEGKRCTDCFIRNFCKKYRFYLRPENPGSIRSSSPGESFFSFLAQCRTPPEFLITTLNANNVNQILNKGIPSSPNFPRSVIFKAANTQIPIPGNLSFPDNYSCYLEFTFLDTSLFLILNNISDPKVKIIVVLNKANMEFILVNRKKVKKQNDRLLFRIPVYRNLSSAQREYSQLPEVLQSFENIPIFGASWCICTHVLNEPGPSLNMDLIPGASRDQLSALVTEYIEQDYYVKSVRCNDCIKNESCRGMHINFIRSFGFGVLKPIMKSRVQGVSNG